MRNFLWPVIILASAFAIGLDALGNIGTPIRPFLAFWFLLVCPGMAFIPLFNIKNWIAVPTLAIALSIGVDLLVSETMVLAHSFNPEVALLVIIAVSTIGVVIQLYSSIRLLAANPR